MKITGGASLEQIDELAQRHQIHRGTLQVNRPPTAPTTGHAAGPAPHRVHPGGGTPLQVGRADNALRQVKRHGRAGDGGSG